VLEKNLKEKNWEEIKSLVLKHWNKLSTTEVEKTEGKADAMKKLVVSKYGKSSDFDSTYDRMTRFSSGKLDLDELNELDDEDAEGKTIFDSVSANYTGLALSEADQEELLKPDLHGMEALDALTNPEVELSMKTKTNENEHKQNTEKKTAPDELKPNQDPHSSNREDIKLGRSNSSANTTSPSAQSSSGATKKL
jgi:hypothetical protein